MHMRPVAGNARRAVYMLRRQSAPDAKGVACEMAQRRVSEIRRKRKEEEVKRWEVEVRVLELRPGRHQRSKEEVRRQCLDEIYALNSLLRAVENRKCRVQQRSGAV